jgi:hypothetical protein
MLFTQTCYQIDGKCHNERVQPECYQPVKQDKLSYLLCGDLHV